MIFSKLSCCPDNGASLLIACDMSFLPKERFKHFIPTMSVSKLPKSLRLHADLQICHIGGNLFVSCPQTFDYYTQKLAPLGAKVIKGNSPVGGTYPADSAYNVCIAGRIAFHNTRITDLAICAALKEKIIPLIHVNQGYTKCSCAVVNENAIITADSGIHYAARSIGMQSLLIEAGHISLPDFDYGFFGGCCSRTSKNNFFISGSLKNHPSRHKILDFLEQQEMETTEGTEEFPVDIGSLITA